MKYFSKMVQHTRELHLNFILQIYDELHRPSSPPLPSLDAKITHQFSEDPYAAQRINCIAIIDNQQAQQLAYPYENYLVILSSASNRWKPEELRERGLEQHCLALIQKTQLSPLPDKGSPSSTPKHELILELWVHNSADPRVSRKGQRIRIKPVMSLSTSLRQLGALVRLHTSQLARDILWPRGGVYFGVQPDQPSPHFSCNEVHDMVSITLCSHIDCFFLVSEVV